MGTHRERIFELAKEYFDIQHSAQPFVPGETYIPATGKVLDSSDCIALLDASLDMWLTSGRFSESFEKRLAKKSDRKLAKLTVSGSAANLLAFTTLCSWKLGDRRIKPGDEVITVAAGFPTTVAPIIQNGCVPVFVDIDLATHNVSLANLKNAITNKTKAIFLAHSLGNPFQVDVIAKICAENDLFLIEDCCDAFGASINGKLVGTFGEVSTLSFYPAHHITMGEGGAVMMDQMKLGRICESIRDWGRDCYCKPGKDNTCGKRFDWKLGELPSGYDHKYTYSHLGYNLKVSDMQAAIGNTQLDKVDHFISKRKENFKLLDRALKSEGLNDLFLLPEATPGSDPSWFGYLLTIRADNTEKRTEIVRRLEERKVGTRLLFGGNLTKQPAFLGQKFRVAGELKHTDKVMNDSFWIGVWPGIDSERIDYMVATIKQVCKEVLR